MRRELQKILVSISRSKERLRLKAEYLVIVFHADEVKQLAKLPSLEIIRAQLLSLLEYPCYANCSILNRPARSS